MFEESGKKHFLKQESESVGICGVSYIVEQFFPLYYSERTFGPEESVNHM